MADTDTTLEGEETAGGKPLATAVEVEPPKDVATPPRVMTPEFAQRAMSAGEEALKNVGEGQKKIAESHAREVDILQHKIDVQAPARRELVQAIDEEQRVRQANPPQPPAPLPERPKLRYNLGELLGPPGSDKPMNRFMSQMTALAAVAGRTPQERMLLVATAFNGMIDGWAKGKQEDFQQRYNEWKDEVNNIHQTETRRRQYIQDVLNDSKASTDLKSLKLQVLGQEDGDRLLVEAAIQKQWVAIDKGSKEYFDGVEKLVKTAESIDKNLQTQRNDAVWDTKAAQAFVGDMRSALRGVTSRNIDQYTEALNRYGAAHGMSPEQIATTILQAENTVEGQRAAIRRLMAAGPAAIARAQADVATTRVAVDAYERLARKQIDTWLASGMKVDDTGSTVVNRWERWLKKEYTGDPDVFAFDLMSQSVRNEVQRVLTTTRMSAILTVNAQREGKEWMDLGMPKEAMFHVAFSIKQEFDNRISAMDEEQRIVNDATLQMGEELRVTPNVPRFPNLSSTPGAGALQPKIEEDINSLVPGARVHPDIDTDIRELVPGATVH